MKSLNLNIGIIALILIVILSNAIYIVNDKQTAILLRFGEIVEPEINPGLHFKVPIYHTVKKFDSRVLTLDALPQPYFTAEKKRLIVDAFVKWRITNNEQFYITSSAIPISTACSAVKYTLIFFLIKFLISLSVILVSSASA